MCSRDNIYTVVPFNQGYAEMLENKRTPPGFAVCEISGLLLQLFEHDPDK